MPYNPKTHHRRSIRLKNYDYAQAGLFFITLCTQNRSCMFGTIEKGDMQLNDAGMMVKHQWLGLIGRFDNIKIHEFIVMPNHFHGIIEIVRRDRDAPCGYPEFTRHKKGNHKGLPLRYPEYTVQKKGQPRGISPTKTEKSIGDIIGAFKSLSTNEYIQGVKNNNWQKFNKKLWQRNYYEHIIRDASSYLQIAEYIQTNPSKWEDDSYYQTTL